MKKFLYMAVAAIAALSSCSNDNDIVSNENGNGNNANAPVFTATIEGEGTRTQLVEGSTAGKLTKVNWLDTDEVFIYAADAEYNKVAVGNYTVTPGENAATATLKPGTLAVNNPGSAEKTIAQYPASMSYIRTTMSDGEIRAANVGLFEAAGVFLLPTTQKFNGTDISAIAPMFAMSNDGSTELQFQNLTALLAITVKAEDFASVSNIKVSSDKVLNGVRVYTPSGFIAIPDNNNEYYTDDNKVTTLDCTDNGANTTIPSGGTKTFYVSIPPATYGYLQIEVTDGTSTKTMKTKAASIEVERNKIYPINFADNQTPAATTGTAKATINGSEVDVDWVQLWADGPKFATQNVASAMTWTDAAKTGADFVWGANWMCPSKDEMDLLNSAKVTYELCSESGNFFYKFTGVEEGYTSNSISLPVEYVYEDDFMEREETTAYYWSSTSNNNSTGRVLYLYYDYLSEEYSDFWTSSGKSNKHSVRPVLSE